MNVRGAGDVLERFQTPHKQASNGAIPSQIVTRRFSKEIEPVTTKSIKYRAHVFKFSCCTMEFAVATRAPP
jgi:hypothetical protein